MSDALLQPEEHVLSTMEADGSRRWLKPKLSKGTLLTRRRWVAYGLIFIFTLIPFLKIGGKPLLLLDIASRKFIIFGFTFLPTDTVLLAIFMVSVLLSIFLFTALFGRVWCGWACPQTVYMEFLFRPIERLFDGTTGRGGIKKNVAPWRIAGKYIVYFLVCVYLANTFLAYFIGVERLGQWVQQSPLQHPIPFLIMAAVTFAMMFDFCFFREQLCVVACPYGRFQSVLLDRNSLIVAYDSKRGEPRGKIKRNQAHDQNLKIIGDCIDCKNCVTTCPTGIDIRDGLQMECINCTQCIDACNTVMKKIGRAPNLIRYSSQARDEGFKAGWLRARTVAYPLLLLVLVTGFVTVFLSKTNFDAVIVREPGNPFSETEEGLIRNIFKLKLTNRTDRPATFSVNVVQPNNATALVQEDLIELAENESRTFHLAILAPREAFEIGRSQCQIEITNQTGQSKTLSCQLIGPVN
jgi:cytochrome c oxidase accessory protein FixG